MKVTLYSAHGEAQGEITARKACRMIEDGDAVPVFSGRGQNRKIVAVQRALGIAVVPSPAAITIAEVERALGGEQRAQRKLRDWPVTGNWAWRHAQ